MEKGIPITEQTKPASELLLCECGHGKKKHWKEADGCLGFEPRSIRYCPCESYRPVAPLPSPPSESFEVEHGDCTVPEDFFAAGRNVEPPSAGFEAWWESQGDIYTLVAPRDCMRTAYTAGRAAAESEQQVELEKLREWQWSISGLCRTFPEWRHEWGGDKDGWGFHFELIKAIAAGRDELRISLTAQQAEITRLADQVLIRETELERLKLWESVAPQMEKVKDKLTEQQAEIERLTATRSACEAQYQAKVAEIGKLLEQLDQLKRENEKLLDKFNRWAKGNDQV